MVASQFIRVDMETKQVLSTFKRGEWEPFNEVIKRLIMKVMGYEEDLTENEKKAILKAVISVKDGKTQSFEEMTKNIEKKRASINKETSDKNGVKKDADGD